MVITRLDTFFKSVIKTWKLVVTIQRQFPVLLCMLFTVISAGLQLPTNMTNLTNNDRIFTDSITNTPGITLSPNKPTDRAANELIPITAVASEKGDSLSNATLIRTARATTIRNGTMQCIVPVIVNGTLKLTNGSTITAGERVDHMTVITVRCHAQANFSGIVVQATCQGGFWTNSLSSPCINADRKLLANAVAADYTTCGYCKYPSRRIIGGENALPGEFPWMVYLEIEKKQHETSYCGGSLIDRQWVLTAAHCFQSNYTSVTVHLGRHNLSQNEASEQLRSMAFLNTHPNYNYNAQLGLDYDFALIKLDAPADLNRRVRTLCLPTSEVMCDDESGNSETSSRIDNCTNVMVSGWGTDEDINNRISPVLKKVSLKLFSKRECRTANNLNEDAEFSDAQMCAGNIRAKQDICNGDSGGPLICLSNDNKYYAIGILSFSFGAECGVERQPSVYSRVCKVRNWIRETTVTTDVCIVPQVANAQIQSGSNVLAAGSSVKLDSQITVKCLAGAGYILGNGMQANSRCTSDGTWIPAVANCIRTGCGEPPYIENGIVGEGDFSQGSLRSIFCNEGYELIGDDLIACSGGQWTIPGDCRPYECEMPDNVGINGEALVRGENALSYSRYPIGSVVVITCWQDYEPAGNNTSSKCSKQGEWLPPIAYCVPKFKTCGNLPTVRNGRVGNGGFSHGVVRAISCNSGYLLTGSDLITCDNGQWTTPGKCSLPKSCSKIPTVQSGTIASGSSQHLSVRAIQCNNGYYLKGASTISCNNGVWSAPGLCYKACPSVPTVAHGFIDNGNYQQGSNRNVFCDDGYLLNGAPTITCLTNGKWSTPGICKPRGCLERDLPEIENGYISGSGSQHGAKRSVACISGFKISGSSTVTCSKGQWSRPGICIKK